MDTTTTPTPTTIETPAEPTRLVRIVPGSPRKTAVIAGLCYQAGAWYAVPASVASQLARQTLHGGSVGEGSLDDLPVFEVVASADEAAALDAARDARRADDHARATGRLAAAVLGTPHNPRTPV